MKIVSWNCSFGFTRKKAEYISKNNADLYVIQECTEDDLKNISYIWKTCLWYGDYIDGKYGVGILTNNYEIKLSDKHIKDYRYIVPYEISTNEFNFTLFSVWTKDCDNDKKKITYTEQTYSAITDENYKSLLNNPSILIGDFNSNNFWDKEYKRKKVPTHNDIITKLRKFNITSCYHKFNNCEDGNEPDPTLLWQYKINQKFHIDYCFASSDFNLKNVAIGSLDEWEKIKISDHCPLIVNLEVING